MGKISAVISLQEPTTYFFGCVVLVIAWYAHSSVKAYWRLRQFDGPLLAAWSNLWYVWAAVSGECHLRLSDVNTRYGSLAKIAPNMLVTSDEGFYRRISDPRTGYRKSDFYKAFRFGAQVDNVFSETDNDRHSSIRKRVTAGYSGRDNPNLENEIDAVIMSMFRSWRERYLSNEKTRHRMDMATQIQYLTLDIITTLSFSQPFGWVSTDTDLHGYIGTMQVNLPMMFIASAVPSIARFLRLPWVHNVLTPSIKDRKGMGKIMGVSDEIITERFSQLESESVDRVNNDMTTSFILHKMTKEEITDNALLAILAGSDTSAVAIRTGLISIITQARIIRKLQTECDEAGVPRDQIISYTKTLELPYLQACVKEALRFFPAGAGLNPRVVPPQGDYFDGKFIPGGTHIGQCAWSLHRLNYSAYGSDADIFRPERWTDATDAARAGNPQRLERMEKAHELVFGYGEFRCLGYKIALIEVSKTLFEIIRRYDIGLLNGLRPMERNLNWGLFSQGGMWVTIEER